MQLQVNLLPRQHRPKPAVRIWPVLLTVVLALNMVGMGSWWLFLQLDLAGSRSDLVMKNDEVAQLEQKVQEAEAAAVLQSQVEVKREFIAISIAESRLWHPMLEAAERAMVPGLYFHGMVASDTGDVTIAGNTDSVKSVANLLGSLQTETGLPVIRVGSVTPEGTFQIMLQGWSGREEDADEQ